MVFLHCQCDLFAECLLYVALLTLLVNLLLFLNLFALLSGTLDLDTFAEFDKQLYLSFLL